MSFLGLVPSEYSSGASMLYLFWCSITLTHFPFANVGLTGIFDRNRYNMGVNDDLQ